MAQKKMNATTAQGKSSLSGGTEPSRPYDAISSLAKQIIADLGGPNSTDTLSQWMAFRLAELISNADAEGSPIRREKLRAEASDVVLRLWKVRKCWPSGGPGNEIRKVVQRLTDEGGNRLWAPKRKPTSYLDVKEQLLWIAEEEAELCVNAEIAGLDLSRDKEYLENNRDDLSDDDAALIEWALELQEKLRNPISYERVQRQERSLIDLDPEQRKLEVIERLRVLGKKRQSVLSSFRSAKTSGEAVD